MGEKQPHKKHNLQYNAIQWSCHDTRLLNLDTIKKKLIIDASFDTTAKREKKKKP